MIFRRRRKKSEVDPEKTGSITDPSVDAKSADDEVAVDAADSDAAQDAEHDDSEHDDSDGESEDEDSDEDDDSEGGTDWDELDDQEWREQGPYDVDELDPTDDPDLRLDLGGVVIRGFDGMELRLQVAEETQQIVSAMMLKGGSALEVSAFAAPRSGGLWTELREEIITAATETGGSVGLVEGPFGTELRRLLPVITPEGQEGYQPSRMWAAQGPRWLLRGVLYGEAAVVDGVDDPAVAELLQAFRDIVVRRGDEAMAPGDLLTLQFPKALVSPEDDEDSDED